MQYKTSKYGNVIKDDNGVITLIPMDESSSLYQEYIKYLKDGGEILEVDFSSPEEDLAYNIELETEKYKKRIQDGQNAYAKISAEFRISKLNGIINEESHKYIEDTLIPIRNEILAGQWISGLQKLQDLKEVISLNLYSQLNSQIENYIQENYK